MSAPRFTLSLTLALLLCACPEGDPSDTVSADSSGDSSGADDSDADTTGEDPATSGNTTTDEPATTDDPTTGGDPTGGLDDGCAGFCAKLAECGDGRAEGCAEWCPSSARGYHFIGEACLDLNTAHNNCLAALTCEQLAQAPNPCDESGDAIVSDTCTTATCRELCDKIIDCNGGDPSDGLGCKFECSFAVAEAFVDSGEACTDAIDELQTCELTLTCEQLDPFTGCENEDAAVDAACG
jgi:hypothetical protein